jgi:hypothetical protein
MMCISGSVAIAPLVTASADSSQGSMERFVHIILGLGLVLLIYLISNSPFLTESGKATFAFLGFLSTFVIRHHRCALLLSFSAHHSGL